jgi:hypothetical protein
MDKTPTPLASRPGAPTSLRLFIASDDTPGGHGGARLLPTLALATPSRPDPPAGDDPAPCDPASTRRPAGGTRRWPHCGPVLPVPYPTDPDDPAAPGDRCPACGYDWSGGAPCVG